MRSLVMNSLTVCLLEPWYLQTIKHTCSSYVLLKWNCCEHRNYKQETHLFKQLPRASKKGQRGWYILKLYICLWSTFPLLFRANALSPWPYLMSQEVVFHLVGKLWGWGGSGCSFMHSAHQSQFLAALYSLLRLLLPQTSTCAAASCWLSIINYLFFVPAWCVSQHRMSAAFHKMALCQVSYDYMSALASLSHCREEFKNFYNLVFIQQNKPVVSVYITLFFFTFRGLVLLTVRK